MRHLIFSTLLFFASVISVSALSPAEATALHEQGRKYFNEGDIAKGREATRQAMEMRRKLFGEASEDYITSLNNYALSFSLEGDNAQAVKYQEKAMALCDRLKKPHKNYGLYALNMGRFYYLSGNTEGARKYWEKALPSVEKFSTMYENLLEWLSMVYSDRGDNANLGRIMALTEEHNEHELTKECHEPECMLNRAKYYATKGNTAKARESFLAVLAMRMDDSMRAHVYESYAHFLASSQDWTSAGEYMAQAADIRRKSPEGGKAYAAQTYTAAQFFFIGKQYRRATDQYNAAIAAYSALPGTDALKKAAAANKGLGNALSAMKDYAAAINAYRKTVAYYEANDTTSADYPKTIVRLAKAEKFNKDYDASIADHKRAMSIFEARGMAEEYSDAASSLRLCYAYAGKAEEVDHMDSALQKARTMKLDNIIREETSGLEMTEKYLGKLTLAHSLATIGGSYALKADYSSAVAFYSRYMATLRDAIRDEFRFQSERERKQIWDAETGTVDEMLSLLATMPDGNAPLRDSLNAIAYDAELLSKGILLNSSIEFEKLLADSGDKGLNDTYAKTRDISAQIQKLRQNADAASRERILALERQNKAMQLQLYKRCSEFADFTDYIAYNWRDVQKRLGSADVAVEFATIKSELFDAENTIMALVLTPGMQHPAALPVCTVAQAQAMESDSLLFAPSNDAVWGKLAGYLSGKRRLFFSADGPFNRIGIEYLPLGGKPISEQMEVYRLSTTKELCYRHSDARHDYAALFGDINYNDDATMSAATRQASAAMRGSARAAGFANLDNTRREIDAIGSILQNGKTRNVMKLTDTEASKKAFLGLSGSRLNILHIATHGAYTERRGATDNEAMSGSILAFAGANLDTTGIVTAAEVAAMNLRQCDLVVLSACETGLGKLGADGVFGLQRGFKNAGAHTLLMSLKNVYDSSTAELMTAFYRHLASGAGKRQSLILAQKELRDKGFTDPKYWATFILLDATE